MAAGIVYLQVQVNSLPRNLAFWSDDGTATGNLTPIHYEGSASGFAGLTDAQLRASAVGVQPACLTPASLTSGTVFDATAYGLVEIEFRTVTGAITIYRDLTDATTQHTGFYDQNGGGPYTTITAAGVYQFAGGGKLKWTAASGSPTAMVRAAQ